MIIKLACLKMISSMMKMTIKELIEILSQFDENSIVVSSSTTKGVSWGCQPVEEVKEDSMYYDGSAYDNDSYGGERRPTKVIILK